MIQASKGIWLFQRMMNLIMIWCMLVHVADAFVPHYKQRISVSSTSPLYASYQHALAILNMPLCSRDRIANEAVIETVLPATRKLSIVLRTPSSPTKNSRVVPTSQLRRYVGEVYSQLWDVSLGELDCLPDVVIYPQNLPNAAPESWIAIQADLDCVCSLEDTVGWVSTTRDLVGRGSQFRDTNGMGGLDKHVANINVERAQRNLPLVEPLHVKGPQTGLMDTTNSDLVIFMDDDDDDTDAEAAHPESKLLLAGAQPDPQNVYNSVCVGGTFDGLHFGHRKLLTLAISSVTPVTGRLYIGVTEDAMLRKKKFAEFIPSCAQRMKDVQNFMYRLAPGMIDRIRVRPIQDAFGPAGNADEHFDALVLSHETLQNGHILNEHREKALGIHPLKLLCTRRTEAHGMSSTVMRRQRSQSSSSVLSE